MQYLIVGAGPAGVNAAETLRSLDPDAGIRILGDEPGPPYSRMAIPYLLMGDIDESGTHLRERDDHFAALGIEIARARVRRLEPSAHRLVLEDGGSARGTLGFGVDLADMIPSSLDFASLLHELTLNRWLESLLREDWQRAEIAAGQQFEIQAFETVLVDHEHRLGDVVLHGVQQRRVAFGVVGHR